MVILQGNRMGMERKVSTLFVANEESAFRVANVSTFHFSELWFPRK